MKTCIKLFLLVYMFLLSSPIDGQMQKQIIHSESDSLIKEVSKLTRYESSVPIVYGKLENYCWDLIQAKFDSIYKSDGGIIIRYPDSPSVKNLFCDSISLDEERIFNKLVDIKKHSTDDMLVKLATKNSSAISIYCFLLLCVDDNYKCKQILNHYMSDNAQIWIEQCGQRKKQKVRDFMLNRLFTSMFSDGRSPMITKKEWTDYLKIAKDYKGPLTKTE